MKKTKMLFPDFFKYIGFAILSIGVILFILEIAQGTDINEFINQNANTNIYAVYAITLLGLVLVIFSKEKQSDENVESLQLQSFLSSIIIHSFFFFVLSFTNLTLSFINFPAILLMNSILIFYLIFYYTYRK